MINSRLVILLFVLTAHSGISQIRLNTLTIESHESYEILGSDILVVDMLIMKDSSTILLNSAKKDNYIHAKKIVFGRDCKVIGKGRHGEAGKPGSVPVSMGGPCRSGASGRKGTDGRPATDGVNLYVYADDLDFHGSLQIDLSGGDGGDGGKGGNGSDGNQGTRLCPGGNGGIGADGASGGDGGNGGSLTFTTKYGVDLRTRIADIVRFRSVGGFAGLGGDGGLGGQRGLSPLRDGNQGEKGLPGTNGKTGRPGGLFFEMKTK